MRVDRQYELAVAVREELFRKVELVGLDERLPCLAPLRECKRVGHRAADQHVVADREQVLNHGDLVAHLLATEDRHERPLRPCDRVGQILNLLLDEKAGDRRLAEGLQRHGHGVHARLGAMAGAEGIVHVGIGEAGEAFDIERVIPLLLPLVEADVFEDEHAAGRKGLGLCLGVGAAGVAGEHHGLAEEFAEPLRDRGQRERRLQALAGRPAQVRHEDRLATAVEDRPDRRQGHLDPAVVGDRAGVILRHVEVNAHENGFSTRVEIGDGLFGHAV